MITVKYSFYSAFLRLCRWWTWRPPIGQSGHFQRHCHHSAPCKYIHISFFLQPLFPSVFKHQPSITEGLVFTVSKDTSWYFRCWTSSLTTVLSCDQMKWKNLIVTLTVGELFLSVCLCLRGMPCLGGWRGSGGRCLKEINILEVDCFLFFQLLLLDGRCLLLTAIVYFFRPVSWSWWCNCHRWTVLVQMCPFQWTLFRCSNNTRN